MKNITRKFSLLRTVIMPSPTRWKRDFLEVKMTVYICYITCILRTHKEVHRTPHATIPIDFTVINVLFYHLGGRYGVLSILEANIGNTNPMGGNDTV